MNVRPGDRARQHDPFREQTPTEIDFVEAIATNPDVYKMANGLPTRSLQDGGRPATHPLVVYIIYVALAGVVGSHRKAACIIANPHYWSIVRAAAGRIAGLVLDSNPPTRNMCEYNRKRIAEHVLTVAAIFRSAALSQAREHGLLNPDTSRSSTQPTRANFVAADGRVAKCPVSEVVAARWRETGRTINADMHTQGGDPELIFGAKFWLATARADNRRNDGIILDIRHVTKADRGEAAIATDALESLKQQAPGLHGVCYDGAFRGTHINRLLKHGLTVLSPTHRGIRATPLTIVKCRCGEDHPLWTRRGSIGERRVLDTGETIVMPSPIATRYPRPNADGTHRWYIEFALSCGTVHRERIDIAEPDQKRRYNRTEHLRQYVIDGADGVYERCYGWREDAESVNATVQRTLHLGRMIAFSAARQYLVMLGFALGRNSLARLQRRRRQPGT
jgi:hypothetical protein